MGRVYEKIEILGGVMSEFDGIVVEIEVGILGRWDDEILIWISDYWRKMLKCLFWIERI